MIRPADGSRIEDVVRERREEILRIAERHAATAPTTISRRRPVSGSAAVTAATTTNRSARDGAWTPREPSSCRTGILGAPVHRSPATYPIRIATRPISRLVIPMARKRGSAPRAAQAYTSRASTPAACAAWRRATPP